MAARDRVSTENLRLVRDRLGERGDMFVYSGSLQALYGSLYVKNIWEEQPPFPEHVRQLDFLYDDLHNMLTACQRLTWSRELAHTDEFLKAQWRSFAAADIDYWHMNFRSLLDYAGWLISRLADRPQQVPESFTKLYERMLSPNHNAELASKLGNDWISLLQKATWYPFILNVRNAVVHNGGTVLIFGTPADGILFQVKKGYDHQFLVTFPPLMYNKNVVFFERYAAVLTAELLLWLDEFSGIVANRLGLSLDNDSLYSHGGFFTLRQWLNSTLSALDEAEVAVEPPIQPPE